MYCRFCGKTIDDDSIYCTYCGKNVSTTNSREVVQGNILVENESAIEVEDKTPSLLWLWLLLPFLVAVFTLVMAILFSPDSKYTMITRDLKSSDYTYKGTQDLTSYKIVLVPNRNIENCDIELALYNSNDKIIYTETISKTDLKKNASYTYNFEYGFVNSFKGTYVKYNITGKCR